MKLDGHDLDSYDLIALMKMSAGTDEADLRMDCLDSGLDLKEAGLWSIEDLKEWQRIDNEFFACEMEIYDVTQEKNEPKLEKLYEKFDSLVEQLEELTKKEKIF
ncbi:MAG: hypothetical protein R3Y63_14115 [Eubacteriales bacterium]